MPPTKPVKKGGHLFRSDNHARTNPPVKRRGSNLTGRAGRDASPEQIDRWPDVVGRLIARRGGVLNLGVRCPVGVIGIDVDGYDDRLGLDTLAALSSRFGDLPPTVRVTARPFEGGSGIRLYRVPADWVGHDPKRADRRASGIELIQRHHRVVALPPSIHHTGSTYQCWDERTGQPSDLWAVDELPDLPPSWLVDLGTATKAGGRRATPAQVAAFGSRHTAERWPSLLKSVVAEVGA
jgi:hypothetical protein